MEVAYRSLFTRIKRCFFYDVNKGQLIWEFVEKSNVELIGGPISYREAGIQKPKRGSPSGCGAYNSWRTEHWKWRATQELNAGRVLGN